MEFRFWIFSTKKSINQDTTDIYVHYYLVLRRKPCTKKTDQGMNAIIELQLQTFQAIHLLSNLSYHVIYKNVVVYCINRDSLWRFWCFFCISKNHLKSLSHFFNFILLASYVQLEHHRKWIITKTEKTFLQTSAPTTTILL